MIPTPLPHKGYTTDRIGRKNGMERKWIAADAFSGVGGGGGCCCRGGGSGNRTDGEWHHLLRSIIAWLNASSPKGEKRGRTDDKKTEKRWRK
jgi:hypothetical protein